MQEVHIFQREKVFDTTAISNSYSSETSGYYDHAGGMQTVGGYLFVPLESVKQLVNVETQVETFYTAVYKISDLTDDIDNTTVPDVHLLALPDGVARGDVYQADVFASVTKTNTGQYLWIDAYYEDGDGKDETDRFRFNISNNTSLESDPEFELITPIEGSGLEDVDIDEDDEVSVVGGDAWNSGTLVTDTNGELFLILTNDNNNAILVKITVDTIGPQYITMTQIDSADKAFSMNGCTFKAGAGGHVTADGILSLFATEYSNVDGDDIKFVWFNVK